MNESLNQRYMAAAHAMQSGVAMWMNYDPDETRPKDLRTGVNSAMVEHGALVKLLVEKGIITNEEFFTSLVEMMELEVKGYEERISAHVGTKVTLG